MAERFQTNSKEPVDILIVDDRPENLFALEKMLQDPSLRITKAFSGNDALGKLLERQFACMLLDVQMPDMDGLEVARIIRSDGTFSEIPIIFVTAHRSGEAEIFRGYEYGGVDFLFKPLQPPVVKSKVHVFAELFRKQKTIAQLAESLSTANADLLQSNQDLERFAYMASHDLQEPMRTIATYLALLKRKYVGKLDGEADEFIGFTVDACKRMQQLIQNLLNFARVNSQTNKTSQISLTKSVEAALSNLKTTIEECGAKITVPALPNILGEESEWIQVFQNLIGNAIKYQAPGNVPQIEISATKESGRWILRVKDNGLGIDSNFHTKIFESFQRLHTKDEFAGTGLGLSICKKVVHRHGGRIWVESEVGAGSTFVLSLPDSEIATTA